METKKTFDAVAFMREQRDRISQEINENPEAFEAKLKQIRERYKNQSKKEKQPA